MERSEQVVRRVPGIRSLANPQVCAVVGCGELVVPAGLYCADCGHQRRRVYRSRGPELSGPADDDELDVTSMRMDRTLEGNANPVGCAQCSFEDCGQPCPRGRLYCSVKCRVRARKEPALFTIDGVRGTLREHASARGLDIGTVYCRMQKGYTPIEAVTMQVDDLQRWRRVGGVDAVAL